MNVIREHFPSLNAEYKYVYLDNAATTLKPQTMIKNIEQLYINDFVNVTRSSNKLTLKTKELLEESKNKIKNYFGADDSYELIFTTGATESINIVANSFNDIKNRNKYIITSIYEHHSNLLPWNNLKNKVGLNVEITEDIELDNIKKLVSKISHIDDILIVSLTQASNVTGRIFDLKDIISYFHQNNIPVMVDGCQYSPHRRVDLSDLNPDFYVCSAHKMLGPQGIGALFVKKEYLSSLSPLKYGGGMVKDVELSAWENDENKFYAGSQNTIGIINWSDSVDFLNDFYLKEHQAYLRNIFTKLNDDIQKIPGVELYSEKNNDENVGIVSFNVRGFHAHDIGEYLNSNNIFVRVGHLCAQPLMKYFNINSCVRASVYLYNNEEDIDCFLNCIKRIGGGI